MNSLTISAAALLKKTQIIPFALNAFQHSKAISKQSQSDLFNLTMPIGEARPTVAKSIDLQNKRSICDEIITQKTKKHKI